MQDEQNVKYIGSRSPFHDRLYRTNLSFEKNQVRKLPSHIARLFLRHTDLFELATDKATKATDTPVIKEKTHNDNTDDTAQILEEAAKEADAKLEQQRNLEELYTAVSLMDKQALETFALDNYQHNIDKRKSVENMRTEVIGLINQYGVV